MSYDINTEDLRTLGHAFELQLVALYAYDYPINPIHQEQTTMTTRKQQTSASTAPLTRVVSLGETTNEELQALAFSMSLSMAMLNARNRNGTLSPDDIAANIHTAASLTGKLQSRSHAFHAVASRILRLAVTLVPPADEKLAADFVRLLDMLDTINDAVHSVDEVTP